jgi:dual specificity tyrosine-phosphorylation-regulated kinase 2/3/4
VNSTAMASASSLASLSSRDSAHASPGTRVNNADRNVGSRSGTDSSLSVDHTTSAHTTGPFSPTASIRRGQSKRLTPSSIPFFRRSSSQSMQHGQSGPLQSPVIIQSTGSGASPRSPHNDPSITTPTTPSSVSHKKSSMLSLGLPSLLKNSGSRRSVHVDRAELKDPKEIIRAAREAEREKAKTEKAERERQKREDKERSESRISVLMGRKRGKVSVFISSSHSAHPTTHRRCLLLPNHPSPTRMLNFPPYT